VLNFKLKIIDWNMELMGGMPVMVMRKEREKKYASFHIEIF